MDLSARQQKALLWFLRVLVDQKAARVLIPPAQAGSGFWFGAGNAVVDDRGAIWLPGRYRDRGDSRTGLEAGRRGWQCALFRSDDGGKSWDRVRAWSKADLCAEGQEVLSIEGTALHRLGDGRWELLIGSEKDRGYPASVKQYQKPGTGVWSIDRMIGPMPEELDSATITPALWNEDRPEFLHVKDPRVWDRPDGATAMAFSTHPFNWSSGGTGLAVRPAGGEAFTVQQWQYARGGPAWDVAVRRVTGVLPVPAVGCFADGPPATVLFYDGAECMRPLPESVSGVRRPQGFSCEEIGGAMVATDEHLRHPEPLSVLEPLFVSPYGTGCSRYLDTVATPEGILAFWQQGQSDGSQPLVGRSLSRQAVADLLS